MTWNRRLTARTFGIFNNVWCISCDKYVKRESYRREIESEKLKSYSDNDIGRQSAWNRLTNKEKKKQGGLQVLGPDVDYYEMPENWSP